jgi:hypothetical protein
MCVWYVHPKRKQNNALVLAYAEHTTDHTYTCTKLHQNDISEEGHRLVSFTSYTDS